LYPYALDVVEIQADSVLEVAQAKARAAFAILGRPLVVHDCGLCVAALNDFPGVYTKDANYRLGTQGLLALLRGKEDRRAGWADAVVGLYSCCNQLTHSLRSSLLSADAILDTSLDKISQAYISKFASQIQLAAATPRCMWMLPARCTRSRRASYTPGRGRCTAVGNSV
jgi:hypothetical protein